MEGKMKTSKKFYTELKVEGLALRKKKIHTKKELSYLVKILNKKDKILDLACGYGRFTIPLAKKGYDIEGIDITPSFIKRAKKDAKKEKVNINFKVGDMRKLPYKDNSFNKIICMWSAFIELANRRDQLKAVKEMKRVLIPGGFAFIDMPLPKKRSLTYKNEKEGDEYFVKGKLTLGKIGNIEKMPQYIHDKKTLTNLMKTCKIKRFKIGKYKFGGRDRFLLQFWKK
jgi:ubiquinone/menaquinone biosynthesis C-methylase UbiE